MGTVHGGVLRDIADAAIGTAHATGLGEGESFTSLTRKSISSGRCGTTAFGLSRSPCT